VSFRQHRTTNSILSYYSTVTYKSSPCPRWPWLPCHRRLLEKPHFERQVLPLTKDKNGRSHYLNHKTKDRIERCHCVSSAGAGAFRFVCVQCFKLHGTVLPASPSSLSHCAPTTAGSWHAPLFRFVAALIGVSCCIVGVDLELAVGPPTCYTTVQLALEFTDLHTVFAY
jgi:hypothetical protein